MFTGNGYFPSLIHFSIVDNFVEIVQNSRILRSFPRVLSRERWIYPLNIRPGFG